MNDITKARKFKSCRCIKTRPVSAIDSDEIVYRFNSGVDAARAIGMRNRTQIVTTISSYERGKRSRPMCCGLLWWYTEDEAMELRVRNIASQLAFEERQAAGL